MIHSDEHIQGWIEFHTDDGEIPYRLWNSYPSGRYINLEHLRWVILDVDAEHPALVRVIDVENGVTLADESDINRMVKEWEKNGI